MSAEAQSSWVRGPRYSQGAVLATSNVAATIDLRTVGTLAPNAGTNAPISPWQAADGLPGHYVRIWAVTADCYIVLADTSAHAAALVPLTAGTNLVSFCAPIFAGTYQDFRIADDQASSSMAAAGPETWLGYRTSAGTGFIIVAQASQ